MKMEVAVLVLAAVSGDSSGGGSNTAEVTKNVIIIVVAGVGFIVGLVLCCCIPGFQPVTGELSLQVDNGPVAYKAGLTGLTLRDRRGILNRLLVGMPYTKEMANGIANPDDLESDTCVETNSDGATISLGDSESYDPKVEPATKEDCETDEAGSNDVENPVATEQTEESTELEGHEPEETGENEAEETGETESKETGVAEPTANADDSLDTQENMSDADHNTTCAICLNDYAEGETVLHGKRCQHMFHRSCAMEWLDKNDHCPFCRKEMISPNEFRKTAVELFGQQRVSQLSVYGSAAYRTSRRSRNTLSNDVDAENNDEVDEENGSSIELTTVDQSESAQTQPAAVSAS